MKIRQGVFADFAPRIFCIGGRIVLQTEEKIIYPDQTGKVLRLRSCSRIILLEIQTKNALYAKEVSS